MEKRPGEENEATGFTYNWKKVETAAQDGAQWRRVVCGLSSTPQGVTRQENERKIDIYQQGRVVM